MVKIYGKSTIIGFMLTSIFLVAFLGPPIFLGVPLEDSILAQQILLDLLQGKSTGFIKISIKSIVDGNEYRAPLLVAIHNFTGEHKTGLSERLVYEVSTKLPKQYIFKINRIPKTVVKGKVIYQPQEFFIHIANKEYIGGMYLVIEPDEVIKDVDVEINLNLKNATSIKFQQASNTSLKYSLSGASNIILRECPQDQYEVSYDYGWVRVGQVHSINGITVKWCIERDTSISLSAYHRDVQYLWSDLGGPCYALLEKTDSGWYEAGSSPADSWGFTYVSQVNEGAKWVEGKVMFKCERWYDSNFVGVDGEHYDYEYYIMTPIKIYSIRLGDQITCSACGSWPPPPYAGEEMFSYRTVNFESGDNAEWAVKEVTLSFGFSIGQVTVTFSITLYRKAYGTPPYIEINVNNWLASKYYWWFEGNDPNKHTVHLTWQQP